MSVSRTFCSRVSLQLQEQQFATASRDTLWLLLEHPGPWGLRPPHDAPLPEATKRYLQDALQQFPSCRVLFIKQERKTSRSLSFFVVTAREDNPIIHSFTLASYDELPAIDLTAIVNTAQTSDAQRTLFLVCTDGKHDYCCAKFGQPIYKAMRALAGDAVWQASHVGGDRFAANVVCFPHGVFYGHVGPEDIPPLVKSYRDRHIYLPKYRGRTCYPFIAQAAEYFIRSAENMTGLDLLHLRALTRVEEQIWRITFVAANGITYRVAVQRELSAFTNYLSCKALEPEPVPQYQLLDLHVIKETA